MAEQEVALVVGVGPNLGAALGRAFAQAGMKVALAARDEKKLAPMVAEIDKLGGAGKGYGCDVTQEDQVEDLFKRVTADLGAPNVVVFNPSIFVIKPVAEMTVEDLESCWRVTCFGGFLVGRAAARIMGERGSGTILFTGASASLRGSAKFSSMAMPKAGLRMLSQSLARELGSQGVHVGHVIVDGLILSERWAEVAKERPEDALLKPDHIAANYLYLHRQPRSAWTQELDVRPWAEKW